MEIGNYVYVEKQRHNNENEAETADNMKDKK